MKELAVKLFIVGKINEWIRKRILEEEITGKGKKGVEKLQNILDEYVWDNIQKFIVAAKAKDNKFIPNFIETSISSKIAYSSFIWALYPPEPKFIQAISTFPLNSLTSVNGSE